MSKTDTQPGPHYQALLQLLRTAETLWNSSRIFFARWDLSPSQFNILNLLKDAETGYNQTDLSRELIMHRSNITGLVDRLEERGLVKRQAVPNDRRAYRVVLTQAGRNLLTEILPIYYSAAEDIWGNIPVKRSTLIIDELAEIGVRAESIATSHNQAK